MRGIEAILPLFPSIARSNMRHWWTRYYGRDYQRRCEGGRASNRMRDSWRKVGVVFEKLQAGLVTFLKRRPWVAVPGPRQGKTANPAWRAKVFALL